MTSDSDDLERALQENLKLRRELAAKAAKGEAAIRRGGMSYRLGWVLYWTCAALALVAALVCVAAYASRDQFHYLFLGAGVAAFVLYGLGRALRYILSGD